LSRVAPRFFVVVPFIFLACSCGRPSSAISDEDATRAALPAWETAIALTPPASPEPTPTPVPPLVAIKLASPDEITGSGLYVIDIGSRETMQITGGVSLQAWLPDGRMLVTSRSSPAPGTYLLDIEANTPPERLSDYAAKVSPDGRYAALSRQVSPMSSDITVFPVDNPDSMSLLIVAGEAVSLAWSADSQWLAITTDAYGAASVLVTRRDNLNAWRKVGEAKASAWSPIDAQIALASAQGITIFDLASDGVGERLVSMTPSSLTAWQGAWYGPPPSLSWSPDSRYLALSSDSAVVVLPVDGEGGAEMKGVHLNGWLADGPLLAVSGPVCIGRERLMIASADGVVERTFDDDLVGLAVPSPDGGELAAMFKEPPGGNGRMEIVDGTGVESVLFSTSHGYRLPVAWSHDGRKLAFGESQGESFHCHGNGDGKLDIHPIQ